MYRARNLSALERQLASVHDSGVTPDTALTHTGLDTLGGRQLDEPPLVDVDSLDYRTLGVYERPERFL